MSSRPARAADLDAVCAIAAASPFAARWSRDQYAAQTVSPDACFAVWDEGGARGYLLALRVADEARVVDLAVRPEDRGRGVGAALLGCLERAARDWGCARLTLEVCAANEPALRLYHKAGFHIVGRRRKFYNYEEVRGDGNDAVLMDLTLA